jgi:hypothetical protein
VEAVTVEVVEAVSVEGAEAVSVEGAEEVAVVATREVVAAVAATREVALAVAAMREAVAAMREVAAAEVAEVDTREEAVEAAFLASAATAVDAAEAVVEAEVVPVTPVSTRSMFLPAIRSLTPVRLFYRTSQLIYRRGVPFNPNAQQKQKTVEDDIVTAMSSMQISAVTAGGEPTMPRRPGYGTVGKPSWVRANFFPVDLPKDAVFMYDVKIDPEVKNKRKRRRLYDILENHDDFRSLALHTATDYGKIMVSTKCLNPKAPPTRDGEKEDRVEITIIYTDTDDSPTPAEGKGVHKFIISRTALIQPSDFEDYVMGKNPNYSPAQAIQAMNIILAKFPSKSISMVPVGRNKFFVLSNDNQLSYDLGAGLIALKGFYTSIRPSVGNILCNLNVCTTAFYEYDPLDL